MNEYPSSKWLPFDPVEPGIDFRACGDVMQVGLPREIADAIMNGRPMLSEAEMACAICGTQKAIGWVPCYSEKWERLGVLCRPCARSPEGLAWMDGEL